MKLQTCFPNAILLSVYSQEHRDFEKSNKYEIFVRMEF